MRKNLQKIRFFLNEKKLIKNEKKITIFKKSIVDHAYAFLKEWFDCSKRLLLELFSVISPILLLLISLVPLIMIKLLALSVLLLIIGYTVVRTGCTLNRMYTYMYGDIMLIAIMQ